MRCHIAGSITRTPSNRPVYNGCTISQLSRFEGTHPRRLGFRQDQRKRRNPNFSGAPWDRAFKVKCHEGSIRVYMLRWKRITAVLPRHVISAKGFKKLVSICSHELLIYHNIHRKFYISSFIFLICENVLKVWYSC